MPEAEIEQYLEKREHENESDEDGSDENAPVFECWPGTKPAIRFFMRVRRHWQFHPGNGYPIALDPQAVELMMRMSGCPIDLELFEDVMTIGDGAVAAMSGVSDGGA